MHDETQEMDYYRTIEDLFAAHRGAPHILSPRDFQLLRSWWRDGIPLAAVATALTDVFAKQREADGDDPVTSLSYCRHAVKRHAKKLAAMQVGADGGDPAAETATVNADPLIAQLTAAAERLETDRPRVSRAVRAAAKQIELTVGELAAEAVDEHLFDLESTLLAECLEALDENQRRALEHRVAEAVNATATSEEARQRSFRALLDRELRLLLDLPRLEIGT